MTMALLTISVASAKTTVVDPVVNVSGEITTNTNWTNDNIYLLTGYVYVTSGNTLTIQEGTIIKGDKATKGTLIIEQGAKLIAKGTVALPIIFTSNQPLGSRNYGDWGGVILCGKGITNWVGAKDQSGTVLSAGIAQVEGGPRSLYGGTDNTDNSGILQYVRIEFGGVAFSPNNEVNGLTLCGVGNATTIDHIQVSFSGDDSYEWFGGAVNAKYIIAHRGWDDDFDMDCGFRGNLQFLMGLRDCYAADQSGSKAFEIDAYQSGTNTTYPTKPVICNSTVVGGLINPNNLNCDPQFVSAAHVRKGAEPKFFNSVFMSYPAGLLVNNEGTADSYKTLNLKVDSVITVKNCVFGGIPTSPFDKTFVYSTNNTRSLTPTTAQGDTLTGSPFKNAGPYAWLRKASNSNRIFANTASLSTAQTGVKLTNPFTLNNPSFMPLTGSGLIYNTAKNKTLPNDTSVLVTPDYKPDFTDGNLSDPFFTKVSFNGAFGTTNWTQGWTNFDPNNAEYHAILKVNIALLNSGIRNINLFPVPANNQLNFNIDLSNAKTLNIEIVDLEGRVISASSKTFQAGESTESIDLSECSNGLYFINIMGENIQYTMKFTVIK